MHAVVVRATIHNADRTRQVLNSQVVPLASSAPGFKAGYWTWSDGEGELNVLAMIIFDAEENARAAGNGVSVNFRSLKSATTSRSTPSRYARWSHPPDELVVNGARRATGFDGDTVAAAVVAEGLAAAVSAGLEPGHEEAVYLWMRDGHEDWLAECITREEELSVRLRADLDSEHADVYARWFLGRPNDVGLPGPQRLLRCPALDSRDRRALPRPRVLGLRTGACGAGF